MRIFENREDEALSSSWEDQVPLAKEPFLVPPWPELPTPAQKDTLPLETFPIIDDFEIVLLPIPTWGSSWRKQWGYHLGFFSQQRGLLACFGLSVHAVLDYSQARKHGTGESKLILTKIGRQFRKFPSLIIRTSAVISTGVVRT